MYKINLFEPNDGNNYFVDWIQFLPSNTEFLLRVKATSTLLTFDNPLPLPMIYSNLLDGIGSTTTTTNPTIQPNTRHFMGSPMPSGYIQTTYENFNLMHNSLPIYLKSRPTNNSFFINLIASNSDDIFEVTSGTISFKYELYFEIYKPISPMNMITLYTPPRPFSILLNSVNGTVINTKSYIQYDYNWMNNCNGDKNQYYEMTFVFQTMAMNLLNIQGLSVQASFMSSPYNIIITSTGNPAIGAGNSMSKIIGLATPNTYNNFQSIASTPLNNSPIKTLLPQNSIFDIQLINYDTDGLVSPLFVPTTGVMNDYTLQLYFNPTF